MNSYQLFRHSRIRLALWYALVMGGILGLSGFGVYRSLIQSNWTAMEREMESIAGTLHDSLEPMLPQSGEPTGILRQIFPDLCLQGQPCNHHPTLIQRHTIGISDRSTYYIRVFNHRGQLLAFSPNHPLPLPQTLNPTPWQTFRSARGTRYHQFTTILHSGKVNPQTPMHLDSSWGYIQIGRTLATFDAEVNRMRWILGLGFPLALGLVVVAGWWLSGLAMGPIYQSYQQQQQFTANAAHELRSPLATLLATIEAILRVPPSNPQQMQAMLQTLERQGRRLSHLIADLLFLSTLEHHTSSQIFKPCCLNDLIHDLTEEYAEFATLAEINLMPEVPAEEIYVLGNESQLYRLVSNLIANAIQYTPKAGEVVVSLMVRDRTALITVQDTGIGMAVAAQTRIFERFYRVDSDRSRPTGGTGLGLAIAQAIAYHHQASLTVKSELGKGSLFTLQFPCIAEPKLLKNFPSLKR
ncbi:MAG: ATP-binding protein [Limnospira sp. PMC 1291.21]|uniref:histidine kinase n=2 Tax=Limnospira TaxID=2596745 RepID=A0A9P1NYG2_9CYAN|nr:MULTISPECIES: two-component system sensor histidine kinase RppB [Limnospira]MDT9178267.1 ATP-binding protein [Limnospira sp. PMC 1238.20]MDT9187423.1 ATP-binding protein [Limnospira sp. PMC 894.15]MDT9192538.1 ATP-binding protein [Limnospira sp. PMC 1245.20]MDT9202809.1 ATP-binding protein [Limnospira sp. PMC 1243.20]MDT9207894.1 ATP-binding protein [Limnospira sp. PMC 1252.20]